MPKPGQPMFLEEDTAAAIALAEEERDTCPSCGLPKAWCRDPAAQFGAFEPYEEQCHATHALALHRKQVDAKRSDESRAAAQVSVRFAAGYALDIEAGLGLAGNPGDDDDERQHGQRGDQPQEVRVDAL